MAPILGFGIGILYIQKTPTVTNHPSSNKNEGLES